MSATHPDSSSIGQRMYVYMVKPARPDELFWEVVVKGDRLYTRSGKRHADGRAQTDKRFASPAAARAEAEKRIARKRRNGFRAVEHVVGEHARNPDIEAMILEEPDEFGSYLVYSDWLQSQGDPRGELIMLEYRATQKKHDARLFRRRRQFDKEHKARFLPEIVSSMRPIRSSTDEPSDRCAVHFAHGFVHSAHIGRHDGDPDHSVRELVQALLHHPSAAFLQELTIGSLRPPRQRDYRAYHYHPVIAAICQSGPVALRTLMIADVSEDDVALDDIHLGELSELWHSLPRLEDLHLRAGSMKLGDIHSDSLRKLRLTLPLTDPRYRADVLRAMNHAYWPRLAELCLSGSGERFDIDALPNLLAAEQTPDVHSLTITHTSDTGYIVRRLAESPLLRQLRHLDLSHGDFSDDDVHLITDNPGAFQSLDKLVLDGNLVARHKRAEIWSVLPQGSMDSQRAGAAIRPYYSADDIVAFAYDGRSVGRARDVADMDRWPSIGIWGNITWGRYQGRRTYETYVEIRRSDDMEGGCTCPSRQYPCKHVIGLLLLTLDNPRVTRAEPPVGLLDACQANRYDDVWE